MVEPVSPNRMPSQQAQGAPKQAEPSVLLAREKAAQARGAELANVNRVLRETLDTLVTAPELSRFLGYVLKAIALQFDSPFLEYWRTAEDSVACLELAVINGEILAGEQLVGHGGVEGHDSLRAWCRSYGLEVSPKAFHIPVVLGGRSLGAIAIFLPKDRTLSEETIELGYALANQAALAIQLTQLAEENKQAAVDESVRKALEEKAQASRNRATELAKTNEAISQALNALTSTPELSEFLGQILTKLAEQVDACKINLFLYQEDTDSLSQYITVQDGIVYQPTAPSDPEMFRHPIPMDLTPAWELMVTSSKPWTLDESNPETSHQWWPESMVWHRAQGHRAMTCAVLKVGSRAIGFMGFCFRQVSVLTDGQLEFIQALANQATLAIQLTRLAEDARKTAILQAQEKATQQRASELSRINDSISKTLTALAASPELDQFLGSTLAEVTRQIGAYSVHMFLFDPAHNTLTLNLVVEKGQIYLGNGPNDPAFFKQPIPADHTPAWAAAVMSGEPLNYDENRPYDDKIWWPEAIVWHKAQGHRAVTCIPMLAGEQPVGFLGFAFRDRTLLSSEQLSFMQALVNQAIIAIQLTRLTDQNQAAALSAALNDERTRLAREIHDTLAQSFTGVSLQLEAARGLTAKLTDGDSAPVHSLEVAQTYILRARDLARKGLSEARRSVRALRSEALETDTLPDALRKALHQTTRDTGLATQFYLEGAPLPLPDDIQLNLLRIAQEAITNTLRYANATQLDLTLSFIPAPQNPQVQLRIVDDGVGFAPDILPEKSGFGLIGIRERATRLNGSFDLLSIPGAGTTLEVVMPLSDSQ